jgi:hypothetical protein
MKESQVKVTNISRWTPSTFNNAYDDDVDDDDEEEEEPQ